METIYEDALCAWGLKAQLGQMAEEASELAVEALHCVRGRDCWEDLAEEIADVEIMISQMRCVEQLSVAVDRQKLVKLRRLKAVLDGEVA